MISTAQRSKGGAILLVLIVITMLSAIVLTSIVVLQRNMQLQLAKVSEVEAEALAQKGLSLGVHPEVEPWDPLLSEISEDGSEGYKVTITSEGSRVNINEFLQRQDKAFLRQLIESWGVSYDDAVDIVDSMVDWVDQDDDEQLNGAEESYYQGLGFVGRPYNRPFASLADLRLVRKFEILEEAKPDWQDFFLAYGSSRVDTKIDIHEAPLDILVHGAEVEEFLAESFILSIRGEDEELGTEDDVRFVNLDEAFTALGVSEDEEVRQRATARFGINSTVRRVTSVGRVGNTTKEITIVVRQSGRSPAILRLEERLSIESKE